MTTAVLEREPKAGAEQTTVVIGRIDYGVAKTELADMVNRDLALTVNGIDDKAGYDICNKRRLDYVRLRNRLDKRRKELNAEARDHIRKVNDAEEELQLIIGPAELHVTKLVDGIDAAKAKIEQDKRDAAFNARDAQLRHAGVILERIVVESLTDDQISDKITDAIEFARLRKEEADRQAAAEAERQRLAAEEKERNRVEAEKLAADRAEFDRLKAEQGAEAARLRKIEDDRIAFERAELDRQRQEQEAAQRKIDEEDQRIAKMEADLVAQIERTRMAAEFRERERIAAEEKANREEADRVRAEQLKPIKERFLKFANNIDGMVTELPNVGPEWQEVRQLIFGTVKNAASNIRQIVAEKIKPPTTSEAAKEAAPTPPAEGSVAWWQQAARDCRDKAELLRRNETWESVRDQKTKAEQQEVDGEFALCLDAFNAAIK